METDEKIAADDDDWEVECSDEEKYQITPEDMRELYEKFARGEEFTLEWQCPGRRSPTPERQEVKVEVNADTEKESVQPQRAVPAAFDFDPSSEGSRPSVTPRRLKGSTKTPRSNQKRVARLDKIMDDMIRHKRMDEEAALCEQMNQEKQPSPKT